MDRPPQDLVTTGPYAWSRNPMYLGHLIFLAGLALLFSSWFAAAIAVAAAVWFHLRVLADERRLERRFGETYRDYRARVPRWIPGLF